MADRLLIIRFSALGDVAMVAHLINYLKTQHPDTEIYLLSKPHFYPIFKPLNIHTIDVDLKGRHKGLAGLFRLSREVKKLGINKIADVHGVIRSYALDFFFLLQGLRPAIINKERRKKRLVTKGKDIKLLHTIERYNKVVGKLGLDVNLQDKPPTLNYAIDQEIAKSFLAKDKKNIGIAPFAAHKNKEYPLENMAQVIEELDKLDQFNILIFGGGKREKEIAQDWERRFPNVRSIIGQLSMEQEIGLIGKLDLMLTMDSGNMHLASLTGTKNIIIWGSTHPKMGFTPVNNYSEELSIIKNLPCQPCTVFGSEKCKRGDFACLRLITPGEIIEKIKKNV